MNNVVPFQSAVQLPYHFVNNGGLEGNKTLQMTSCFNTGKKFMRDTNLKFSEGSLDTYQSFRSQINIHHKMLGWDTQRAGIELYMNLEVKAALKVEKVILTVDGKSNIAKIWDALDRTFLLIDHRESKYSHSLPPDVGDMANV